MIAMDTLFLTLSLTLTFLLDENSKKIILIE